MKREYAGSAAAMRQRLVWVLGAFAMAMGVSGIAATESNPVEFLKRTTQELFDAVRSQRTVIATDPGIARSLVREHITPHIDLERTSRWVLGKYWRDANESQRQRFVEEFRTLLVRTYATAITEYVDSELIFFPLKDAEAADDVTVRTKLPQKTGEDIEIFYRMYRSGDGWKVYDVTVGGVSLVTTYRASFAAEVRKGGIDGLIERLSEKNRA